jgi:flagellar biosynthetic protein FlhB
MSEKTQKPTARHLSDARKKGDIARSSEATRAFVLVGCLIWLGFGMAGLSASLLTMIKSAISNPELLALPSPQAAVALLEPHLMGLLLPPLILIMAFSVLGDFLQVRGLFSLSLINI